ncbi:hypothetical protein F8O01_05455 [Pseudoclavibacter chungangensis]|uniref:NADP-dependent oxidoreductase domain-containing protein n=1 Tax=Pseudoclavibacter chungangensis TaxID=587635 RepID=A0A7J5BZB6_9MICO|nr:aldo/keto reductase [Pseudoclavibacter chungangensis]KAB1659703.1 hypothetical protein F8O01_05455 [Pseudoclavibacter chungangensis]NYJ67543.1 L-glyceraldehyde 3-phosphate reductase [Pseudoclavibacter chungangensis]
MRRAPTSAKGTKLIGLAAEKEPITHPTELLDARRAGRTGLVLPTLSLGLWHTFGEHTPVHDQRERLLAAFDAGIWHIDTANRYGPPHGHAEEVLGSVLARDLAAHRSEIMVSTKAGNRIGPGAYGAGGSRKHLLEALDASLGRLRLDHVDVFYLHRPDPEVDVDETVAALAHTVTSGRAHYVGISNADAATTTEYATKLRAAGVPLALHQHRFSLLDRDAESGGLHDVLGAERVGGVVYSPLAQGLLTDHYLAGSAPAGARAGSSPFLGTEFIDDAYLARTREANELATRHARTLAQLALQWVLRAPAVTSAILGVSRVEQLHANIAALQAPPLDEETLAALDRLYPAASSRTAEDATATNPATSSETAPSPAP